MTDKQQISFRLSKDLDDWVMAQIESGRFESWDDVIDQALVLLQERLDGKKQ
jgi:Arc/MetJ-type ribon-helix-helix transcriptional regulator